MRDVTIVLDPWKAHSGGREAGSRACSFTLEKLALVGRFALKMNVGRGKKNGNEMNDPLDQG